MLAIISQSRHKRATTAARQTTAAPRRVQKLFFNLDFPRYESGGCSMPISRFGEFDHATKFAPPPLQTTDPGGANLSFVRHLRHYLTRNPITMNRLPLCPKKAEFSGPVRHRPTLPNDGRRTNNDERPPAATI